jgi:hypothetical protein
VDQRLAIIVPWHDERDLAPTLEALVELNVRLIPSRRIPHIYKSGVRYQGEERTSDGARRKEHWLTAPIAWACGVADCEDLGSWLAACYRLEGIHALAIPRRNSIGGWHIVTQMPDGSIQDPSRVLGMGRHDH